MKQFSHRQTKCTRLQYSLASSAEWTQANGKDQHCYQLDLGMDLQERELCETRRLEPYESRTEPKESKEKRMSAEMLRSLYMDEACLALHLIFFDNSLTRRFLKSLFTPTKNALHVLILLSIKLLTPDLFQWFVSPLTKRKKRQTHCKRWV